MTALRLTGEGDDGAPEGIGLEFQPDWNDEAGTLGIDAWDDEGNHVGLVLQPAEVAKLRDFLGTA